MDSAPSWDEINLTARVLFANKFNLELNIAQRMSYEEFERLFYHLFILIDAQDAKRKFSKLVYPAMDQSERNKFIDAAVRFINDKQLCNQRVATSQLRMYGGESFRRLVGALMSGAADKEISSLSSRSHLPIEPEQAEARAGLEEALDDIESLKEEIIKQEAELKEMCDKLAQLRTKKLDGEQQADESWRSLTRGLKGYSNPRTQEQALDMVTSLLSRLETSSSATKEAVEQLRGLRLSAGAGSRAQAKQQQEGAESREKRLSQFIREAKAQLNTNQQTKDALESNLAERIRQQFVQLDNFMDQMLGKLRVDAEKADEAMLRNPELLERYKQFEEAIPLISLPSMIVPPGPSASAVPTMIMLAKILAEFPEPGRNDRDVLEVYEKFVVNKQPLRG